MGSKLRVLVVSVLLGVFGCGGRSSSSTTSRYDVAYSAGGGMTVRDVSCTTITIRGCAFVVCAHYQGITMAGLGVCTPVNVGP